MSYAIEVRRVAVRIHGLRGEPIAAEVFLHAARPHDPGIETLADRLNSREESFLPCKSSAGVALHRLDSVAYFEAVEPEIELSRAEESGAAKIPVQLELATGETLAGSLICQLGAGHRLSDFLNLDRSRFLMLLVSSQLLFVNKDLIDRIGE